MSFDPASYLSELHLARKGKITKGRVRVAHASEKKDSGADTSISALAGGRPAGAKETTVTNNGAMAQRAKEWREKVEAKVKAERKRLGLPEGTTNVNSALHNALAGEGKSAAGTTKTETDNNPEFNAKHPRIGGKFAAGSSGNQVGATQIQLGTLGYSPGPVDQQFGPRTTAAVKQFQTKNGLTADGVVGPKTQTKLYHPTAVRA